jgi:Rod binding domain-containing protein
MSSPDAGSLSPASAAARLSEPSWVRNGSAKVQQEYALGVEFEQLLVQQLAGSLTESSEPQGEGSEAEGGDAAGGVLSSMIPGALAEGVVSGGGLGLAAELARQMQSGSHPGAGTQAQPQATAGAESRQTDPSGGTEANVSGGTSA